MVICTCMLLLWNAHAWAVDYYFRHWDANNSTQLVDQGSSIYASYFILSGDVSFKVSDASWTSGNTYGKSSSAISLNSEYSCTSPGGDFSLNFPTNRAYLVRFNASASTKKLLISTFVPSAAAPSAVVSGTNAMFYIQGYEGLNYLVNSSKTKASNSYPMNYTGISYVNTAKTNLSTYDRISNNPSDWNGDEATNIQSATGGELITRENVKTAAKTASTTTSVTGDVLSISTTTNSTTGVYGSLPLYIQYYIDGTFVGVTYSSSTASYGSITAGGATARASTYNVSSLTNGSHTLKTVLTDGIIYWVADQDNFNVAHTYDVKLHDNNSDVNSGSATVTYGDAALTVSSHASKAGWNLVGYWTASDGGSQVADAAGNLVASVSTWTDSNGKWIKSDDATIYAHWNQINSLSVVAGTHVTTVTGSTSPVTLNSSYAINATAFDTGWEFYNWTASPAANGTFANANSASTNVTVKNGSVTVTANAREKMTTVTVNVSPSGAGTLTLDASAFTPGNTTTAGVATSHTVVATALNSDYTFNNWSVTSNATGTASTNTYTLKGNGSAGTGTLTANFNLVACNLLYGSSTPLNSPTDGGAMSYDNTEQAYYKDVTTNSSPYYFRFSHSDEKEYAGDWNTYPDVKEAVANGDKIDCDQTVQGWENKASIKYTGASGNTIRIWFDYANKKAWITEQTYSVTCNAGANGSINAGGTAISASGSQVIQVGASSKTLTATPATGYHFTGWTKTGSVTIADASSDETTMTATGTGTVTATWAPNTIFFVNSEKWSTVKMYGWDGAEYGKWPGTAMTDAGVDVTIDGRTYDVYKMDNVPAGSSVIINNGQDDATKKQTADLSADDAIGKYFFADECFAAGSTPSVKPDGAFYASTSAVEAAGIQCYQDHRVTFGVVGSTGGTLAGTNTTTSSSISSGAIVGLTNAISLTATPSSGYAIEGWYTDAAGSVLINHNKTAFTKTFTGSDEDLSVYVKFEALHTVTLSATNGKIQIGGEDATSASVASNTTATITAVPDSGYYFTGWTVPDGVTITSGTTSSATITIKSTADSKTVTANFALKWSVASTATDPEYDTSVNLIGNISSAGSPKVYTGYKDISLAANTDYQFQIVNREGSSTWYGYVAKGKMDIYYADDNTAVNASTGSYNNFTLHTAAAGTYRFYWSWNSTTKQVKVDYPTSYYITSGVVTEYNEGASSDKTETGGTFTAVDNSSNNVKGGKFVASGANVTFTAEAKTGYQFDGWYTDENCTTGKTMTNPLTVSSISANVARYAKFKEKMTTVKLSWSAIDDIYDETCGWVRLGGVNQTPGFTVKVGVHTSVTLKIYADSTSHYFAGWSAYSDDDISTDSVGADYHATMTLHGLGAGDANQSIYISFPHLERIYFKNWNDQTKSALWDSVYVGFDPDYDDTYGYDVYGKSADDVRAMKRQGEDDFNYKKGKYDYYCMWWSYVPRHITRTGNKNVVFFNKGEMKGQEHFWKTDGGTVNGKAAGRGDYSKKTDMFVPASTKCETKNYCDYYSNGYWRNYWVSANEKQGYYLQKKTGTNTYEELGEFLATKGTTYTNEFLTEMEYTVRFDNTSAADFRIVSAGGEHYIANANLTSGSPESYLKSNNNDDASFRVTPTAEGNYVFKIVQSSDTMDISVEYPVVIGDYVLENTYNDGSAKTTRSNIIKASTADTKTRYAMYISNAGGSATLKLRKCTAISIAGVPTWSTGDATNLAAVLTAVGSKPGVYQFDLTINKSTDKVSDVDSLRLYSGNYYIKVDAAPGGWAGYTRNVMDKNSLGFDRTKSYTFDNYWCKYYGTGTAHTANIKCVVANDYCNQLSDTLKQDALSIAWMSGGEPYVPNDGTSIRFSYNSATNTINRAYLKAQDYDDYLDIKVSTDDKVYNTSDEDLYGESAAKCRFTDTEDWVYEKTVKVIPGGKAGVVANYASITQTFLPDTTTLIGSSDASSTKYTIRLVYDFKTNYMMSSFLIDGSTINENLSDFDMLWVRHKDESATQLTLGAGKKLTNVRPIAAIEFCYDSVNYYASHTGHWQDLSSWNIPGARPYLKYFVSFPFDVEMNSIFGLNQASYGLYYDYVIQKYNGAKRAEKGLFFGDDNNYWENVEMGDTLKANEGYCVIFDNEYVSGLRGQMWEHKTTGSKVYLYFPALKEVATITNSNTETTVPVHTCTIDRSYTVSGKTKNHMITDSHWNLIGNPLFHDAYIKNFVNGGDSTLKSYYYMDLTSIYSSQDWQPQTITKGTTQLKAMSSVLVQWCGTINWGTSAGALAAPRRAAEEKDYLAQLEIKYNGVYADQTFISLSDDANADFVLREDMCKVLTTARPNIYTFAGDYDVAYNELPVENCTIPVGVLARRTGTYTFSMPKNFSGTVTLIDKFAQTRTNLNIEDYEVYLNQGTIDDRFELEININKVPTAIDGVTDGSGTLKDGKVHKFIMNDQMYILKDGVLYDARGNRVK